MHGFLYFRDQSLRGQIGIIWNDPDFTIPLPVLNPVLSDKNREYLKLRDLPEEQLQVFGKGM
jgi:hypothetical protein